MTCSGPACAAGSMAMNQSSCSKCADQCSGATTAAACTGSAMNSACVWNPPACGNAMMMMTTPCSGASTSACTQEAGCFWLDFSTTVCGQTTKRAACYQCNSSAIDSPTRSALAANVGKTCTWAAMAPYGASSVTINSISQSSDTANCPAMMGAMAGDPATITTAASKGTFGVQGIQASQTATCASQSSGVATLIPSLAFLGLIVVVA